MKDGLQSKNTNHREKNKTRINRMDSMCSRNETKGRKNILERKEEIKPKGELDDEETEQLDYPRTQLQVGDVIVITRSNNVQQCKRIVKDLIKDKHIKGYLNYYSIKNYTPSYTE